jgi:hypothetical protein
VNPIEPDIAAFLDDYDAYGRDRTGPAPEHEVFAASFLALDPAHVLTLTPAQLAAALPARRRRFDAAGVGDIHRTGARQLRLDDRHVLVSATWSAARDGADPVMLSSSFLLRREGDAYQIVVYVNHVDLDAALG